MASKLPNNNYLIDLHLHIDGAISPVTAICLAEIQGTTLPSYDVNGLNKYLRVSNDCNNLTEYLRCFDLPVSLMQTHRSISEAVFRVQEELIGKGLAYAELRFAPQLHTKSGLTQYEVVNAAVEGLNRSQLHSNLILCCMRFNGNQNENMTTVKVAGEFLGNGVVGIDIAGDEKGCPVENYSDVFSMARSLGIPFTIHAGEADGAQSVINAVMLGASRIGHGVRSAESDAAMRLLSDKGITLELCPTSNLQTRVYPDISVYPFEKLFDNNVLLTVNTDNPIVSDTDLKHELQMLSGQFGLKSDDVKRLLTNSVNASFACPNLKNELNKRINDNLK